MHERIMATKWREASGEINGGERSGKKSVMAMRESEEMAKKTAKNEEAEEAAENISEKKT